MLSFFSFFLFILVTLPSWIFSFHNWGRTYIGYGAIHRLASPSDVFYTLFRPAFKLIFSMLVIDWNIEQMLKALYCVHSYPFFKFGFLIILFLLGIWSFIDNFVISTGCVLTRYIVLLNIQRLFNRVLIEQI